MQETRTIEFKETITNTFLKTVSAFSNYNGGKIFFGIDDSGKVKGLANVKQACLDIENKINDSISPQPDYTLEAQKDHTIILSVKSGASTSIVAVSFLLYAFDLYKYGLYAPLLTESIIV